VYHGLFASLRIWNEVFNRSSVCLISNSRRVLNVVFFRLGDTPGSEFNVSTFRNTPSVPSL